MITQPLSRQRFHADILPFTLFWLSCLLHMPFSVGLHTTIGVSAEQRSLWRTLDFLFIFSCSGMPLYPHAARCMLARHSSTVLLAVSLAYFLCTSTISYVLFVALCVAMLARTLCNTMIARNIKDIPKKECASYVAGMATCYVIPMVIAAGLSAMKFHANSPLLGAGSWHTFSTGQELVSQGPGQATALVAATLVTLKVGGAAYAHHYPERWAPGRFDLVGNSHQLMHVLAMLAHYTEWRLLCLLAEEHLHTY